MAQELNPNQQPDNLNPNGQSINSAEMRAPQFVGGGTDPTTGNIIPSSTAMAAAAQPQSSTTMLGDMEAPKKPSMAGAIGGMVVPPLAGAIGARIGAGEGLVESLKGGVGDFTNTVKSAVGFGSSSSGAPSAAASGAGAAASGGGATFGASGAPMSTFSGAQGFGVGLDAAPSIGTTGAVAFGGNAPLSLAAPAAESGSAGAASGLGGFAGAAGAGIGSFAIGLLTGEKPLQAAEQGAASAAGFFIGNMILPGIGGFIGSFLGGLFCHAAGTMIRMADGTFKAVETLTIGDQVALGGMVIGRGEVMTDDLYDYRGTRVTGRHAAFEAGCWLRVEDSPRASKIELAEPVKVYPVLTQGHLLVCEHYVGADFAETDDADMGASERLAKLNQDWRRNQVIDEIAAVLLEPERDDVKSAA